jgi:hypothetical protein
VTYVYDDVTYVDDDVTYVDDDVTYVDDDADDGEFHVAERDVVGQAGRVWGLGTLLASAAVQHRS